MCTAAALCAADAGNGECEAVVWICDGPQGGGVRQAVSGKFQRAVPRGYWKRAHNGTQGTWLLQTKTLTFMTDRTPPLICLYHSASHIWSRSGTQQPCANVAFCLQQQQACIYLWTLACPGNEHMYGLQYIM